jgi:hypothetical protein
MKLKNINPSKTAISIDCARALVRYGDIVDIADIHYQTQEVQNAISNKLFELIGKVEVHPQEEEYSDDDVVRYKVNLESGHLALQYLSGDKRSTYRVSSSDKILTVPKKHSFAPDFLGAEKAKLLLRIKEEELKLEPEFSREELDIIESRTTKTPTKAKAKTPKVKVAKKSGRPRKKKEDTKKEETPFEIADHKEEKKPKKIKSVAKEVEVMDLSSKTPESEGAIKAFDDFLVVETDGPRDMLLGNI